MGTVDDAIKDRAGSQPAPPRPNVSPMSAADRDHLIYTTARAVYEILRVACHSEDFIVDPKLYEVRRALAQALSDTAGCFPKQQR